MVVEINASKHRELNQKINPSPNQVDYDQISFPEGFYDLNLENNKGWFFDENANYSVS